MISIFSFASPQATLDPAVVQQLQQVVAQLEVSLEEMIQKRF